jgi:hypothetical protein
MNVTKQDDFPYWIRYTVLVLLCCQNAGHALLTRYSQGVLKEVYSSTGIYLYVYIYIYIYK